MVPLNPKITNAGLALFPNPNAPGFQVTLTHIAIGTGKYDPTGTETALAAEVARFPIVGGGTPAPYQVQIAANLTDADPNGHSANEQWIGEIGFYAGSTLFAVWSKASAPLFYKTSAFDIPIAYTMDISILPASSVTVTVVPDSAAMQSIIFAHENRVDPHPQYLTPAEGDAAYVHQGGGVGQLTQSVNLGKSAADASKLKATINGSDFGNLAFEDWVLSNINTSAAGKERKFDTGTRMLFQQTAAPVGWTKDTTLNERALRIVSGTVGSGGTVDFTTAFNAKTPSGTVSTSGTVGDTSLSVAQLPSHDHSNGYMSFKNDDLGFHGAGDQAGHITKAGWYAAANGIENLTVSNGSGASHTHSFSASSSFSGAAMDFAVKYTDVIIASKD